MQYTQICDYTASSALTQLYGTAGKAVWGPLDRKGNLPQSYHEAMGDAYLCDMYYSSGYGKFRMVFLIVNLGAMWLAVRLQHSIGASLQTMTHSQELPRAISSVLDGIVLEFGQECSLYQHDIPVKGVQLENVIITASL
jgi:hypothetical protein